MFRLGIGRLSLESETLGHTIGLGSGPFVTMSERAEINALRLWNDYSNCNALRIYLEGKGCDGFFYGVTFDHKAPEDIEFGKLRESELALISDPATLEFIKGSIVDWVDDERGAGFLVENPKHSNYRGKFFKREIWKQKLVSRTTK